MALFFTGSELQLECAYGKKAVHFLFSSLTELQVFLPLTNMLYDVFLIYLTRNLCNYLLLCMHIWPGSIESWEFDMLCVHMSPCPSRTILWLGPWVFWLVFFWWLLHGKIVQWMCSLWSDDCATCIQDKTGNTRQFDRLPTTCFCTFVSSILSAFFIFTVRAYLYRKGSGKDPWVGPLICFWQTVSSSSWSNTLSPFTFFTGDLLNKYVHSVGDSLVSTILLQCTPLNRYQ